MCICIYIYEFLSLTLALAGATGIAILGVDQNEGTAAAPIAMAMLPNAVCLPVSETAGVSSSDVGYNSSVADIANGVVGNDAGPNLDVSDDKAVGVPADEIETVATVLNVGTAVVQKHDGSTDDGVIHFVDHVASPASATWGS